MQYIKFPMDNMKITQIYGTGTHKGTYAIDNAGKDSGIESAFAPFDGVIKKIWKNGNTVWLESAKKVKFADGTEDYATVSFTHDNNVSDLKVGNVIKQGNTFYQEGTAGYATGNHVHIEIAKGKFTGTGWYKNSYGIWTINNKCKPEAAFFVNGVKIINSGGLKWKKYSIYKPKYPLLGKTTAYIAKYNTNVRNAPKTSGKISGSKLTKKGKTFWAHSVVTGEKVTQNGITSNKWLKSRWGNYTWAGNYRKK